jgi:hypothetical protein
MRHLITALVSTLALTAGATTASAQARSQPSIITNVKISPVNGGINPDAFAYRIEGEILAGGNACEARGVKVGLAQSGRGVVHLTPYKQAPRGAPRACIRLYDPVYVKIAVTVRGFSSRTQEIVLDNVDELGQSESLTQLLADQDAGGEELTGILTRVLAIGGETTGIALALEDGSLVELDLAANALLERGQALEGETVRVKGRYTTVHGVEIPSRQVLVVDGLSAAAPQ